LLDVAKALEKVIHEIQPNLIYTHHGGDLNVDHRIAFQAVMTACRPQPNFCVKKIISFEVNSSTEWSSPTLAPNFIPNYHVNISSFIDQKVKLLNCYESELRESPHSRSIDAIEALAKVRGAHIGVNYAEAFMLVREVA